MINIRDLEATGKLTRGHVDICLSTITDNKQNQYKVHIIEHDAFRLSLIKFVDYEKMSIKLGHKVRIMSLSELVFNTVRYYPYIVKRDEIVAGMDTVSAIMHSWTSSIYPSIGDKGVKEVMVLVPKQLMEIVDKIGLDVVTFVNEYLYPALTRMVENTHVLAKCEIANSYTAAIEDSIFTRTISGSKLPIELIQTIASAILVDIAPRIASSEYYYRDISDWEFQNDLKKYLALDDSYVRLLDLTEEATYVYVNSSVKDGLKRLYNYILNNIEDFGLGIMIFANLLESYINGWGIPILERGAAKDIEGRRKFMLGHLKDLYSRNRINSFSESYPYFETEAIASQVASLYTVDPGNTSDNKLTDLIQNVMPNQLVDSVPTVNDASYRKSLHDIHFRRFYDKIKAQKEITVFNNPKEKSLMIEKMVRLIDEVKNTKDSFTVGKVDDTITKELGIYDVLIDDATKHIDFLNSIKYYGNDESVANMNAEAYANGEGCNVVALPLAWFPVVDNTSYGEATIFGGTKGPIDNLKSNAYNKVWGDRGIYDRDGNLIRQRKDKVTLDNMSHQEYKKFYTKMALKTVNDSVAHDMFIIGPIFRSALKSVDHFYGGLRKLLWALHKVLIDTEPHFESYEPTGLFYVDYAEDYLPAFNEYVKDKPYTKTKGDRLDDVVKAPVNGTKAAYRGTKAVLSKTNEVLGDPVGKVKDGVSDVAKGARYYAGAKLADTASGIVSKTKSSIKSLYNNIGDHALDFEDGANYTENDVYITSDGKHAKHMAKLKNSSKERTSGNKLWAITKIAALTFVFGPVITLFWLIIFKRKKRKLDKYIEEKVTENASVIKKGNQDCLVIVEEILEKGSSKLGDREVKRLEKLRDILKGDVVDDKSEEIADDDDETKASGEAVDVTAINKMVIKKQYQLRTPKDVYDLSMRLLNTTTADNKITPRSISYQRYNGFWAFVETNKGTVVYNLDNAYTPIPEKIRASVENVEFGKSTIPVSVYDMDTASVESVLTTKSTKSEARTNNKKLKEEELRNMMKSTDLKQVQASVVKEFEDNLLKRINNKMKSKEETDKDGKGNTKVE